MTTSVAAQIKALPIKKVDNIQVDLTKYNEAAANLIAQAERAEIKDADDFAAGGDLIKIASTQFKKVDEYRTSLSGPFHKMWKWINDQFSKPKNEFNKVRGIIEPKMLAWKKVEDERLRVAAAEEAARLEEEALAKAALETEEEDQDAVMEEAGKVAEKMVDKATSGVSRGNFGASTSGRKVYETRIDNQLDFVIALCQHITAGNKRDISLGSIIEFKKSGLNQLAKEMREQGVKRMPGAEFTETQKLSVR